MVGRYLRPTTERFLTGLSDGLDNVRIPRTSLTKESQRFNVDAVVPHQASGVALDSLSVLNWPEERQHRTLERYGNTIAASIPLTLCDAVESGAIKRGQRVVLCGTSAGMSFGGILLTY